MKELIQTNIKKNNLEYDRQRYLKNKDELTAEIHK
jgi:hypothetical protein